MYRLNWGHTEVEFQIPTSAFATWDAAQRAVPRAALSGPG